ncbi:MAG: DMT family transporter [Burkholderiales bacterium]|nr:DMT family transporter [Burkholderiales bacterium]
MPPLSAGPQHHLRGILLIVTAVSIFAIMDTTAKYLSQTYPVPAIVWYRYCFQALFMLVVLGPRMKLDLVRTRRPGLQVTRAAVLALSTLIYFSALSLMPIAEAAAITYLAPLLLTAFSVLLLRERVSPATWVAVATGFVGVLIIIRPGGEVFRPAALLPLATAFCFATYQLMTRQLAGIDSSLATLFYSALVGAMLLSFVVPFYWLAPQSLFHGLLLAMLGILGSVGHFVLIRAFGHAPASVLAPFVYAQLVSVLILGYLVFGDFPDRWTLLGMGIIVASGAFVASRGRR